MLQATTYTSAVACAHATLVNVNKCREETLCANLIISRLIRGYSRVTRAGLQSIDYVFQLHECMHSKVT